MKSVMKLCILTLAVIGCLVVTVNAEEGVLVLHVTSTEGRALPGVVLSPRGDGSVSSPTDRAGRTRMKLAPDTRPGKWVTLQVVQRAGANSWVFISPWDARVIVPPFDNESNNFVPVVLARRSDRVLLENGKAIAAITKSILNDIASKTTDKGISEEQRRAVLAEQAQKYGLNPDEIDKAIRGWGERAKDPFDKGLAALYAKNYPEAVKQLSESLRLRESELEKSKSSAADAAAFLGQALYAQGKYREAVEVYQRAANFRPDDIDILNNLAAALLEVGEYAKAESLVRRVLEAKEKSLGPQHYELVKFLTNLVVIYIAEEKYDEGIILSNRALEILNNEKGPRDAIWASAIENAATLSLQKGALQQAAALYKQLLEGTEQLKEIDDVQRIKIIYSVGFIYYQQENYPDAESYYNKAIALGTQSLREHHPLMGILFNALANVYKRQKRYTEAETSFKKALMISEKEVGAVHPDVSSSLNDLATLYIEQKRYPEAEPLLNRSLAIEEELHGKDSTLLRGALNNLAVLYFREGKYKEAEPLYKRAIAMNKSVSPKHPGTATAIRNLAKLYHVQGKYDEAEALYKEALTIWQDALGAKSWSVAFGLNHLANLYRDAGKYPDAETLYKQAIATAEASIGAKHPDLVPILNDYIILLQKMNKTTEAENIEARAKLISPTTP